jgi:hypothetical protein
MNYYKQYSNHYDMVLADLRMLRMRSFQVLIKNGKQARYRSKSCLVKAFEIEKSEF